MSSLAILADKNEQIRILAHRLWEQEGRPEGRAEEHWLQAERILAGPASEPIKAKRKSAKSKSTSKVA